jgi:hypothetical protein
MKYIFTIHSPITFLMCISIVRREELSVNDVIIITSNYKPPIQFGKVEPSFAEQNKSLLDKAKSINAAQSFDKYIDTITKGQEYTAFIDIMHNYQKLLVTNQKCKLFHFFEEGTDSYMNALTLEDFTRTAVSKNFRTGGFKNLAREIIRSLRGYTSAIHSLPYHSQSYQYDLQRNYYCLSDYCYPGVPSAQKIKVSPQFSDEEINILSSNYRRDNSVVLIEETYPEVYSVSDDAYKRIIEIAWSNLKLNKNEVIYLKLRPSKSQVKSRLVRLLDELSISYEVLPHGILAEGFFLTSKGLRVVGFVSSLLFYASIFGHEAYSFMNLLENRPKTRFDNINGFKKLVKNI